MGNNCQLLSWPPKDENVGDSAPNPRASCQSREEGEGTLNGLVDFWWKFDERLSSKKSWRRGSVASPPIRPLEHSVGDFHTVISEVYHTGRFTPTAAA
jgi:hypothetical protein